MKKLIILCLFLFHSTLLSGKETIELKVSPDTFYFSQATENMTCRFNLDSKTSCFVMTLYISIAFDMEYPIFMGSYTRSGQFIHFKDIQTGMVMTAKISGNSLTFTKAPAVLKNKEWVIRTEEKASNAMTYKARFDAEGAKKKRAQLYDPAYDPTLYSIYIYGYISTLVLNADQTYALSFDGFPAFTGNMVV